MKYDVEIEIGRRLYILRNLLMLTREHVFLLTKISTSTLTRIESGKFPSKSINIEILSNLYQIEKADLFNIHKPLPTWKTLKKRVLAAHRSNQTLLKFLNERPEVKNVIEFRLLQTTYLNTFKTAKQVMKQIKKSYSITYTQSTVKNSLDILVDNGIVEIKGKNVVPQEYRKSQRIPKNQMQAIEQIRLFLEEYDDKQTNNLVTPTFDKMAKMMYCLKDHPKKRAELFEYSDYKNATNNNNRSLKVLEDMGLIEMTIKDKPTSSRQMYQLTDKGWELLRKVGIEVWTMPN